MKKNPAAKKALSRRKSSANRTPSAQASGKSDSGSELERLRLALWASFDKFAKKKREIAATQYIESGRIPILENNLKKSPNGKLPPKVESQTYECAERAGRYAAFIAKERKRAQITEDVIRDAEELVLKEVSRARAAKGRFEGGIC